jgi:iron complex transport system substrate-binding protein
VSVSGIVLARGVQDESMGSSTAIDSQDTVVLIDNLGREVELPYPVTRAVAPLRYNNELIRACGAIDFVISADMNTAQDREYWTNFDPENVIGKSQRELNFEKIIELNPQVLLLPHNGQVEESIEKLTPFGIQVYVLSGYDTADFERQVTNLGTMFGTEAEAERFLTYFTEPFEYIEEKLQGVEKRTVYWESTRDYATSFPGGYYFDMIVKSGAVSIFADPPANLKESEIDPEAVITADPDFIIKNITPDKALAGTGVYAPPPTEQRQAEIDEIRNRPGWDEIAAVQNGDIYLMSQFGHGGASKLTGALYIAKWVYPDILTELDPNEYFEAWLEDFQGFRYVEGHFHPLP